jgi:acyl-coenzyme A thioesterase PaaI-like protein
MALRDHELIAFNTATASANLIHDDAVARRYGFAGGLVPGVDVYAYITHPLAEAWGVAWLESGALTARFLKPVYDGHKTTVTARETDDGVAELTVVDDAGALCATATGRRAVSGPAVDLAGYPPAPVPDVRHPAEPEAVGGLDVLGSIGAGFHADKAAAYLDEVREDLALYAELGIAHPGWLLRWANWILSANVALGPWIHVESDVRHLGLVRDGDDVEVRGRVVRTFERKGHDFVELDLVLVADGDRPVQAITHTAIYRPRSSG